MTTQVPQIPGIPGIPVTNNLIPAPGGGGFAAPPPETYTWSQLLQESNIQEQSIPAADYDAQVVAAEPTKSKDGKDMINATFQLISGPYAGKRYSRNITLPRAGDTTKFMRVFFRQMKCLGCDDQFWVTEPNMGAICQRIMNRQCRIQMKQREFPTGSGLIDNEVGFIRDAITGPVTGMMPSMINQGAPPMPQFGQQQLPQGYPQPVQQQPPQQYAQPQQYPAPGQQYMTSSTEQSVPLGPDGYPQQTEQLTGGRPQPAPQLPPAQQIPVGTEHAQAPQQYAPQQQPGTYQAPVAGQQPPPPPPQTPPFEQMLTPPQQAPQAQQLTPPPSPYPQAQAVPEPTPADAQPAPQQVPPDQAAAFAAFMAQQAAPPQQGAAQQPPAPPLPRDF